MAGGKREGSDGEDRVSIRRLPKPGSKLFGRAADTAWLDACWTERAHVATIVAAGGVGKSALVWDWLRRMQSDGQPEGWRGAERVYGWSFYSQGTTDRHTSADAFIAATLTWFGDADPDVGSPWDKGERLARLIRKRRVLLVLDGVEPLQWGTGPEEGKVKDPALATLLGMLWEENAGLCVVTSRLPVEDVADSSEAKSRKLDLRTLSDDAGAELLRSRGVNGTDEELRATVRDYKGHSLALLLLGSYLKEIAEGDVRRRHEIGPLVEEERLGGHAVRVMAAYERMFGRGSPEVAILRILGLFDRSAEEGEIRTLRKHPPIAGLTVALADVREQKWNKAVARLRRVGLVEEAQGTGDGRLDAHPLVREFFGERLKREQAEAWREGNRRLFEYLRGKANPLPETAAEMEPLYAAAVHGCRAGKSQEALDDVWLKRIRRGNEAFSLHKLGAFGSEVAMFSAFFDPPWEQLAPGISEATGTFILNEAGFALRALGRLPEATALMRMSLDRGIAEEYWDGAARVATNLGEVLQARGELCEALEQAEKGVELADKSDDTFTRMYDLTTLAAVLHAMGRRDDAAARFAEAERMQAERQPDYLRLYSLQGFRYCDLLLDQDRDADVRERAMQTLEWGRSAYSLLHIALDQLSLGRAHLLAVQRGASGDLAQAGSHLTASVDGLRRAGQQDYLPLGLLARAALYTHTGDFDRARHDLDEALTLATRCGFRLHQCDAHLGHARLAFAQGDPAAADGHLVKARAIVQQTGYHRRDEELAALEAEARLTICEQEKGSRKERKEREEERGEEAGFAVSASFARNSPAPSSRHASTEEPNAMSYDVAIVCALRKPELEKVLATGKQPWTSLPLDAGDPTQYRTTTFERTGRPALSVVAAAPSQMGMTASATVTTKMVQRFKPKLVAMVGIAGGVDPKRQGFGDVLAPATTFDYGAGKLTVVDGKLHLSPDANPISIAPILRERLEEWGLEEERLAAIRRRWSGAKPNTVLKLHVGPLGSGAAVVAARETVEATKEHWRKLIGIEMEAYGVHHASQLAVHPPPMFLCMKSICDFAGPDKDDDWQDYAAYTAAQLCHLFLTEEWDTLFPR